MITNDRISADRERLADLRHDDLEQHAQARGAEVARRLDGRAIERRHRARDQQRGERRLLPDEGDDDAAPVEEAHRLDRLVQAEPVKTLFIMPFLARKVRISWPATTNGMNNGQR